MLAGRQRLTRQLGGGAAEVLITADQSALLTLPAYGFAIYDLD